MRATPLASQINAGNVLMLRGVDHGIRRLLMNADYFRLGNMTIRWMLKRVGVMPYCRRRWVYLHEGIMEKVIDWVSKKTLWLVSVPICIVVGTTVAVPIYSAFQSGGGAITYEINGSIGDFFGGIMNPIVALLALVWLVKGVSLQQKELEETKKALQESANAQVRQVEYSDAMLKINALTALITLLNNRLIEIDSIFQRRKVIVHGDFFGGASYGGVKPSILDQERKDINEELIKYKAQIAKYLDVVG